MAQASYNQFCPIAMASEIICTRWTLILLRELIMGATRFNELRRGVPRMSPALLSKRLKDLEVAGIITRAKTAAGPDLYEYKLTPSGKALEAVVFAVGGWGQQWVSTKASLANLDVSVLMWNMRRNINADPLPPGRSVIQIIYSDLPPAKRNWWLIVQPGKEADLCSVDPGFDVDLYISTDLRTMTEAWMGYTTVAKAKRDKKLIATGSRQLENSLQTWLGQSVFAKLEKFVA